MSTIPIGGLSVEEFRAEFHLSYAQYKNLQDKGLGPRETLIPDSRVRRILPPDYADWLKRIKNPDIQLAEVLRRQKIHRQMGRAALKSKNHPSNLLRGLRADDLPKPKPPKPPKPTPRPPLKPAARKLEAAE
jgi:hypothetical protein